MKYLVLDPPTFGVAVATRAALGVGIGLLLADRMPAERRRKVGMGLVAFGAATTIPVVRAVLRGANGPRRPLTK